MFGKRLMLGLLVLAVTAGIGFAAAQQETPGDDTAYEFSIVSYQRVPVDEDAKMVRYWEEQTGVTFDIWNTEQQNYAEVMNLRFAADEIPDFLNVPNNTVFAQWARQDFLAEIPTELIQENAPNAYKLVNELNPDAWLLGRVDGVRYGLVQFDVDPVRYSPMAYRGDWLETLGLELPETLDEFEDVLYAFAQDDPDGNGRDDTYGASASVKLPLYGAFGLGDKNWVERDGRVVYSGVQPEMKEALGYLRRWYADGVLDPEFITGEGQSWWRSDAFIAGRVGFSAIGGYTHWKPSLFEGDSEGRMISEIRAANPEAADSVAFGKTVVGPYGDTGIIFAGVSQPILGNVTRAFGVHLEDQPDRYAKLLNVLDQINYGGEMNFVTRMFGIEGEDWEMRDGQIASLGPAAEDPSNLDKMGAFAIFRFTGPYNPPQLFDARKAWAEEHNFDMGILKHAVLEPVPAQAQYETELHKIEDETFVAIITGELPLDAFDDFVERWRVNGGDEIEQQLNAWYQNFYGAN